METSELIKTIRSQLGVSQEAFAEAIHVAFSTVNRWENSKSMYQVMNDLGFNAAKLFPGYDGVKRKMLEDDIMREHNMWFQERRCQQCEEAKAKMTEEERKEARCPYEEKEK